MKNEELNPRIKIRSPLRCDGIGRLDCAEDTESGARLAVRWLPLDANGESAVRACAKLPEHPTLPRVRQTGVTGDKAFLAMEFPDGKLLSTMIGEAVSGDLLLETGAQLADALATIHSQGVVHGEMSAESVLLAKGKAFLWDMPLVIANRLTDRRGEERLMHQLVRTAPFLSPERARGGAPSPEGDVYGLAAVMCLVGGAPLPPAGTTLSVVHAIVAGEWAPVVPPLFHEPFRSLLMRMLSREPLKRPGAREVADLLGKPAAAIPTIPEMPAIVLPAGIGAPPLPRPPASVKSPFSAAPGALEPMLPPKAVADAAKAQPSKPLQVTVPTQVESTVKVNVPVQVLVAMSQPIAVDAELKAVVESLKPIVASDVIPTLPAVLVPPPVTKTLEFGTATPPKKEKTPPPTPAAVVAEAKAGLEAKAVAEAKAKTPPPAAAPTVAEVKAALDADPLPPETPTAPDLKSALQAAAEAHAAEVEAKAAGGAPQAAITAPNPPPIPRKSSKELPPVVSAEAKAAAVEVQENVCISAETYAAGAEAVEELEPLDEKLDSKPTFLIAAALLALLTVCLAFGARALTKHDAHAAPARPQVAAPSEPLPAPSPEVKAVLAPVEDELTPLPQPKKRSAGTASAPKKPAPAAKLQGKYDSASEAAPPPLADDFSFLNAPPAEAPKEELKRPEF